MRIRMRGSGLRRAFEEEERRARLFKLVERLPRDQSRVIVMRFAEDKSIREIAAALGRSEGSIKQLQFRGLQNLRVRLGDSAGSAVRMAKGKLIEQLDDAVEAIVSKPNAPLPKSDPRLGGDFADRGRVARFAACRFSKSSQGRAD